MSGRRLRRAVGAHPTSGTVRRYGYACLAMARPGFMAGTLALYLVGVAAALHRGAALRPRAAGFGLALVWSAQLATHYANEYRDVETDRITDEPTRVSGGSRVLVRGIVPPAVARAAAVAALASALVLAAAIGVLLDPPPVFHAAALVAVVGGWFYSEPPVALSSRGLGEVTVAVVAGALVPGVAYLLQRSTVDGGLLVVLPLVPLAFATSLATALPDIEADRATGKLTLPARIGAGRAAGLGAAALVTGLIAFGYVALALDPRLGAAAIAGAVVPLAAYARYARRVPDGSSRSAEAAGIAAVAAVATLGWTGLSTAVLLLA